MRVCKSCKQEKPLEEFPKFYTPSQYTEGRSYKCNTCTKAYQLEYRKKNTEKLKILFKKHYEQNKNKILARDKIRRSLLSPEQKQNQAELARQRHQLLKNDIEYQKRIREQRRIQKKKPINRICRSLSRRLVSVFAGQFLKQTRKDLPEFQKHIESKFLPGMSWENYGQWHIDHIKPVSSFDLTIQEQIKAINHYTNLQPLWAKDNVAKGNKYENL